MNMILRQLMLQFCYSQRVDTFYHRLRPLGNDSGL